MKEKEQIIILLKIEIEKLVEQEAATNEEPNLNQTRIVASEPHNEIYINLRQENIKLMEEIER